MEAGMEAGRGPRGISQFMRRFLTGYAIAYNLRHRRHGHLQVIFKSSSQFNLVKNVPNTDIFLESVDFNRPA